MGCMCMECKDNDIITDSHAKQHRICTRCESEYFLQKVSTAFGECNVGEVDMRESEDTE